MEATALTEWVRRTPPPEVASALVQLDCVLGETLKEGVALKTQLTDAISALRYIEQRYGRLDGVGWDRLIQE